MGDNVTEEKARKNSVRVGGVSALRKIRKLVDDFETQERSNRKMAVVTAIILIVSILLLIYYFTNYDHKYAHTSAIQNDG